MTEFTAADLAKRVRSEFNDQSSPHAPLDRLVRSDCYDTIAADCLRENLGGRRWWKLVLGDLAEQPLYVHWLSDEGFLYYLPAMLLVVVEYIDNDGERCSEYILNSLECCGEQRDESAKGSSRMWPIAEGLTPDQRKTVADVLRFSVQHECCENLERQRLQPAIHFWESFRSE